MGILVKDLSDFVGNYDRIYSMDGLKKLIDKLYSEDAPISFDIETGYSGPDVAKLSLDAYDPRQFIAGFSITNSPQWARYVPVMHDFGGNLDHEEVWTLMKPLLEEKEIIAYNALFEARNMKNLDRKGHGPQINLDFTTLHDPMIQSYVLSETRFHGLKSNTLDRYNYPQAEIKTLFPKITEKQKSAIRFNPLDPNDTDVLNYVCDDVTWAWRHDDDQRPKVLAERNAIYGMEREISGILIDMAEVGVSVDWEGITQGFADYTSFYQSMLDDTRKKFEEQLGRELVNVNFASPKQLQTILFDPEDGLGLTPAQKTPKGEPSTGDTSLEAIRHQNPAVDQLLKLRSAKKMGDWFKDYEKRKGTAYDDKLHPNFKQTTVQSGRFACDAPNVQNITKKWWFSTIDRDWDQFPKDEDGDKAYESYVKNTGKHGVNYWTGNARDYLVASPGYKFLIFDYKQQELRILAGLAKEPYLIESFNNDVDVHEATASLMFNTPIDKVTKDQRARGKTINFGNVYGQGAKAMGDQLGISKQEAQDLFDRYFSAFSKVSNWFDKVKREAKEKGYVESFLGRKSTIWDYQSKFESVRNKGDRMAVNVPVQGGGADISKLAMIRSKRMLMEKGWWMTKVRLLMNQHDSLIFEVSDDLDLNEVKDLIEPQVSFPVPGFPKFDVDWETGTRWGSCDSWEDYVAFQNSETVTQESPKSEVTYDIKVTFNNPTRSVASAVINSLKRHPGSSSSIFVMNGKSQNIGISVDAGTLLASEIKAVSQGTCEVELISS